MQREKEKAADNEHEFPSRKQTRRDVLGLSWKKLNKYYESLSSVTQAFLQ